jgi:hypothetical protein
MDLNAFYTIVTIITTSASTMLAFLAYFRPITAPTLAHSQGPATGKVNAPSGRLRPPIVSSPGGQHDEFLIGLAIALAVTVGLFVWTLVQPLQAHYFWAYQDTLRALITVAVSLLVVVELYALSTRRLAQGYARRLALSGVALALLSVPFLLGHGMFLNLSQNDSFPWAIQEGIQGSFWATACAALIVLGMLAADPWFGGARPRVRSFCLAGAAWVLSLAVSPLAPYLFHNLASLKYASRAPQILVWWPQCLEDLACLMGAGLLLLSLLVVAPQALVGRRLVLGASMALLGIGIALNHPGINWPPADMNLVVYTFSGSVLALLFVAGAFASEFMESEKQSALMPQP